jgi:hypothetical protein
MKKGLKPAVWLMMLAGVLIGTILFAFGAYDDAPGVCAIGLSVGFVLIMLGINKTGVIKRGLLTPILLFVFGVSGALLTTSILLDGEFESRPWLSLIGYALAVILLLIGVLRIRIFRNIRRSQQ